MGQICGDAPPHAAAPQEQAPLARARGAGEAIRLLRLESGLSQEELADRMQTDLGQIGGIERGSRNPSYTTLLRLAHSLDARPGEIVSLADRFFDESGGAQPAESD